MLLGINWRLRIDNNIAVSKEEREEKGGVRVLPATDEREIDEGFVMAQNVSNSSAVAQPLSYAPARSLFTPCLFGTNNFAVVYLNFGGPEPQNKDTLVPDHQCAHRLCPWHACMNWL